MVKIYTKGGDSGQTSLVSGTRVLKSDSRIDLYGDIDELNSFCGHTLRVIQSFETKVLLQKIQNTLFDLGSQLACEAAKRQTYKLPQIKIDLIQEMESSIDQMQSELPKLKNFILPGGSEASSRLHLCRVIARRVERKLVDFSQVEDLPEHALIFLNRLSDYFFVASRYENHLCQEAEILWGQE
ncbi:MAG: cob(I)yrinic acid a,c-diamide adenosyltransferase [Halobacteriovoraceae bacterium]|nr:cob(I)yrinic acid a,c-diamide adenosyltransferase [Halobacteriovoraceae bacterium]